jgi:hypothetical protein
MIISNHLSLIMQATALALSKPQLIIVRKMASAVADGFIYMPRFEMCY